MTTHDPKGLIREAYRIEGITQAECRSIFLDWALSMGQGDASADITALLAQYGGASDHPMTQVLQEGLQSSGTPKRRGGWKSRDRSAV